VLQQHYIEEINNKSTHPEMDGSCVNGAPVSQPENTDQLSCIRWEKMFFRYGCHPEHSWPEHTHEQDTILFFPEENSGAEFSWRSPDGRLNTVILEGKHACFVARNVIHSLRWKRKGAFVCLHVHDELQDQSGAGHGREGVRVYGW
jgi:hypothetical protein